MEWAGRGQKAAVTLGNGDLVAAEVGPPGLRVPQGTLVLGSSVEHPQHCLGWQHCQDWGSSPSFPLPSSSWSHYQPLSLAVSLQAWLTEIHEYAQQDVVLMLLGNKVSLAPGLCQSLLFLPRCSHRQGSLAGRLGTGRYMLVTFPITANCSWPFLLQVDSAQDRVVKREDGEKLAKVCEVPEGV